MATLRDSIQRGRGLGLSYRAAATLLALNMLAVLFEGIGIAMLLPVLEYLEKGGDLARLTQGGTHWSLILSTAERLSMPVNLATLLAMSFMAILLRQLFNYLKACFHARVLFNAIHQLRTRAFGLSLKATTALQQDMSLGQAVNDVAVELPRAVNALYGSVNLISRLLLILVYVGGLALLAPWMTAVSLLVLVFIGSGVSSFIRQSREASVDIVQANRAFAAFLLERLQSLRLIRLSGTEAPEIDNLDRLSAEQRELEVKVRRIAALLDAVVEPTAILLGFIVLYLGYSHFAMTIGSLGVFMVVMMRLLPLARDVIGAYQSVQGQWQSLTALELKMRSISSQRESVGGSRRLDALTQGISFRGVAYAYSSDAPALSSIDCDLPAGRMTALVGPSGAGKSTFIDLLPRLRDATEGTIAFDGVPISEFAVKSLRSGIAYVPQSPQLFNVRVRDHIRYGRTDASEDEIRQAAALAGAKAFIERMPQGFDTMLGENASKLSGGQRQRLDIARALLRRAPILILDEASSQLDADSELELRKSLDRLRGETRTTIIVVGHRLSAISDADQILVFEQGRISERGRHADLMARGGWYAHAVRKQGRGAVEEGVEGSARTARDRADPALLPAVSA